MPSHGIVEVVALAPGLKPFFTGDNTVANVPVQASAADRNDCHFSRNGLGVYDIFRNGDAVLILGGGCRLPYVYAMATLPLVIDLNWVSTEEIPTEVPAGQLVFPFEGKEIDFGGSNVDGIFIPSGGLSIPNFTANWFLCAKLNEDSDLPTVDQFYAPDSLNGQDLEIDVWLKIQHTLALQGGS